MSKHHAAHRLLIHARWEALAVLIVNVLALLWTVGYCYLYGYQHAPDSWVVQMGWSSVPRAGDFQQIGGLPDWVMYGIVAPWLICTGLTILGCLLMRDDDLGQDLEEGAGHGA